MIQQLNETLVNSLEVTNAIIAVEDQSQWLSTELIERIAHN